MARKPVSPDQHHHRPLEPVENHQFRQMRDEWMFRRWFKTVLGKTLTWTTGVLVAIGLFRDRLAELYEWLVGLGGPPQ